jgi:hypothetical protein
MVKENEIKEKENGVVAQVVQGELTVKSLGAMAAILLAVLGAIGGAFAFVDSKYVSQELFDAHKAEYEQELTDMNSTTAQVIQKLEEANQQEFNKIYKAIKDGTALPLIVRRDLLIARGSKLTDEEKTELKLLETKLDELNIQYEQSQQD